MYDWKDFHEHMHWFSMGLTFKEAFERTGRIVNINVSGSSTGGKRGALLLNHLTAPHVLIRSAVHASCCLPTVMHPTSLLAKAADGSTVPFGDDAAQWIDGSFTADIPRRRLSELFHVTQDVVSQVSRMRAHHARLLLRMLMLSCSHALTLSCSHALMLSCFCICSCSCARARARARLAGQPARRRDDELAAARLGRRDRPPAAQHVRVGRAAPAARPRQAAAAARHVRPRAAHSAQLPVQSVHSSQCSQCTTDATALCVRGAGTAPTSPPR